VRSIDNFTRDVSDRVIAPGVAHRPGTADDEIAVASLDLCEDLLDHNSVADLHDHGYAGAFDNLLARS